MIMFRYRYRQKYTHKSSMDIDIDTADIHGKDGEDNQSNVFSLHKYKRVDSV